MTGKYFVPQTPYNWTPLGDFRPHSAYTSCRPPFAHSKYATDFNQLFSATSYRPPTAISNVMNDIETQVKSQGQKVTFIDLSAQTARQDWRVEN